MKANGRKACPFCRNAIESQAPNVLMQQVSCAVSVSMSMFVPVPVSVHVRVRVRVRVPVCVCLVSVYLLRLYTYAYVFLHIHTHTHTTHTYAHHVFEHADYSWTIYSLLIFTHYKRNTYVLIHLLHTQHIRVRQLIDGYIQKKAGGGRYSRSRQYTLILKTDSEKQQTLIFNLKMYLQSARVRLY